MDTLNPVSIPLFKKKRFLEAFSEDEFRDKVVRPLFLLKGLTHGKDVCGVDEDGKDCYFWGQDPIRGRVLYVVQTKKGDIKMSAKARTNLLNVEAQLRTALKTPVFDATTKQKHWPDYVIIAASGEINKKAEEHITREIQETRLIFRDSDDLITDIDDLMPQLWYGIDARRLPYLKSLRDYLVAQSDTIDMRHLDVSADVAAPITDDTFVQLYLNRITTKPKRHHGTVEEELDFQEIPVQQVLKRQERLIIITGEAGAGKTTMLRRLAMILVEQALREPETPSLPVFLHSNVAASKTHDLSAVAASATKELSPGDAPAFSMDDLRDGSVVVLIDAFDELAQEDQREVLLSRIDEFHAQFPDCQVLLTSRDYPFIRDAIRKTRLTRFNVSPINLKQAERMVDRLSKGKALAAQQTQEVLRRLDNVHGMDLNPLLVTVFVATTDYARTDIPANITELFKKFTEMMLGRWDQSKGLSQQYQAQVKDFLLCKIGFKMHSQRVSWIGVQEARRMIEDALAERDLTPDVDVLFDEILNRSGLLRIDGDRISFRHLLLQEFFAGRGIVDFVFLETAAADYWWMRAIVFYFGEKPDDHQALAALRTGLNKVEGSDRFQAAVTVGLAVQACYLTTIDHRCEALEWVTETLAASFDDAMAHFEKGGAQETLRAVFCYLYGRDAVATRTIRHVIEKQRDLLSDLELDAIEERRLFWCIAGLIESRELEVAETHIQSFHPSDARLLLALHLGLYHMEHLQVTADDQKKAASRLRAKIEPLIEHLRKDVIQELKGYLLEVRQGRVHAIDGQKDNERLNDG